MTALSTLEAYDLLRHCATLTERIARAEVDQLSRAGLEDEKAWLHQALERVEPLLPVIDEMLGRCRELPELVPAREDHAQVVQGAWVDALERLVGGLTHHAGSRAPILETLFPHLKFPALRRGSPEVVRAYAADFERRSRLGYVKRILSGPDFAFAEPLVIAVFDRYAEWESCFEPGSLSEEEAAPLREELAELTATVERHMRQARLLAEASLCPVEGAFEASGIGSRPRRRVGTVEVETPPGLDPEPEDDGVSLIEALGWGEGAEGDEAHAEPAPSSSHAQERAELPQDDAPGGAVDADAPADAATGSASRGDGAAAPDADSDSPAVGTEAPEGKAADPEDLAAEPRGAEVSEEAPLPSPGEAAAPASSPEPEPAAKGRSRKKKGERKAKASRAQNTASSADAEPSAADAPKAARDPVVEASDAAAPQKSASGNDARAPVAEASDAAAPQESASGNAEEDGTRAVAPRRRRGRARAAPAVAPADD